ncbi:MAG TPA: sulfite exporter TauE/SafE family protein, partial [Ferruginibacter sp.]|nr:sulfite exporter TauE/SafE family protein [Ferruginibacter sp.]
VNNYRKGQVSIKTALLFGLSSITTVFITRKLLMPAVPDVLGTIGRMEIKKTMLIMVLFAALMLMASVAMIRSKKEPENADAEKTKAAVGKLLLYGILIGLATGFLGAGGGFLIIPALVLLLHMPMKKAIGTSLLIIALNSLIGFTGDIGHIAIEWKFLLLVAAIAIAGIFIGGALAKKIPGAKLKKAFGWFVLVMGIYIILKELFFRN